MTRRIIVVAAAQRDIKATLDRSRSEFGAEAHAAYKALIDRAILDLAEDPARIGVRDLSELKEGVCAYHLRFSRARVGGRRVGRPRHLVLFRATADRLVVARLLHERMLLSRHL